MSGVEAEARSKGSNVVVVTGWSGFGGDVDGSPGGGTDGGGKGDGWNGDCNKRLVKWVG